MTPTQQQRVIALALKGFSVQDITKVTQLPRLEVFKAVPRHRRRRQITTLAEVREHLLSKVPPDREPAEYRRCVEMNFAEEA